MLGIEPGYPTHKTRAPVLVVPCQYEIQDFSKIIWKKQISSGLDGIALKGGRQSFGAHSELSRRGEVSL